MTRRPGRSVLAVVPLAGFLYVLLRPVSNGPILLSILICLAALGLATGIAGRHRTPALIGAFVVLQLGFGALFVLIGAGNPGARDQLNTFVGFPLVYWLIVYGLSERTLRRVFTTLAVGCILIATTIIVYVGSQQGILPPVIPQSFLQAQAGAYFAQSQDGAGTAIQFYGLATLAAGAPIWVASLVVANKTLLPAAALRWVAAMTSVVAVLVAGREAILITTALTLPFTWIASRLTGRRRADRRSLDRGAIVSARRRARAGLLLTVVGVLAVSQYAFASSTVTGSVFGNAWNALTSSFLASGTSSTADSLIRSQEGGALLQAWRERPLTGWGLGAIDPGGLIRNSVKPWDFELQYHMLLFDTGLLGVVFAIAAVLLFVKIIRRAALQRPDLAGALTVATVGMLSLLAAAASNPYLQAPGYNWALYLPLAVANVALASAPVQQAGDPPAAVDESVTHAALPVG